jgi:hypothetical protein
MERIVLSKNFFLDEYVPEKEYLALSSGVLIRKLNPLLIKSDQLLRDEFGEIMINNWHDGGSREYSGWMPYDAPFPRGYSDHREGNASDKIFMDADRDRVISFIKTNYKDLGITIIENFKGMDWVHTSVAWTNSDELIIVGKD